MPSEPACTASWVAEQGGNPRHARVQFSTGDSFAGCAAAIALRRAGCAVTVYERSRGKLEDRGAGIGMPLTLLRTLIERDWVDAGMAHFHAAKAPFVLRADPEDGERGPGRLLWEQPIAAAVTNWGIVYRHIRSRIPEAIYHQGQEVMAVSDPEGDTVSVQLADGHTAQFDLVVCADGPQSVGQRLLFPAQALQYVGYILWRGLAEEQAVANIKQIPRSSRRNSLPMKRIHGALLMGHESLARALVELRQIRKPPSRSHRVFHHTPEAFDGVQVVATMGR